MLNLNNVTAQDKTYAKQKALDLFNLFNKDSLLFKDKQEFTQKVEKAILFIIQKHFGQFRKSGEPYYTHPVAVAEILAGLKIDLSHASLQGWDFEVYSDPLYTIKLGKNYYVSGKPGFDQSYVLITNAVDVPRTLYCRFVGPQTLNMVINI